eukprot:5192033-Prymnesium_polylepis.1
MRAIVSDPVHRLSNEAHSLGGQGVVATDLEGVVVRTRPDRKSEEVRANHKSDKVKAAAPDPRVTPFEAAMKAAASVGEVEPEGVPSPWLPSRKSEEEARAARFLARLNQPKAPTSAAAGPPSPWRRAQTTSKVGFLTQMETLASANPDVCSTTAEVLAMNKAALIEAATEEAEMAHRAAKERALLEQEDAARAEEELA